MLKAKDVMTKKVITLSPDATLVEATKIFIANGITGIPIVDADEKVIGIITEKDILNFVLTYSSKVQITKIKEAMTKNVICFTSDTDIDKIALCFSKSDIRRVPIVDEGRLVGIISRKDLISSLISHDFKL
jgi:CBS domain-containing protein